MQRKSVLLEVVRALHSTCSLACRLNSGKQKTYQDTDDGNNHQQFDERESTLPQKTRNLLHENES
jgi:hypothetical protein